MSKRFGRNRRRQLQQRAAELERAVEQLGERVRLANNRTAAADEARKAQGRELQALVAEIERVARHSALLPPKAVPHEFHGDRYRIPIMKRWTIGSLEADIAPRSIECVDLQEVAVHLARDEERHARLVHIQLPNGKSWRYMVSEDALRQIDDKALRGVACSIVEQLFAAVEKALRP